MKFPLLICAYGSFLGSGFTVEGKLNNRMKNSPEPKFWYLAGTACDSPKDCGFQVAASWGDPVWCAEEEGMQLCSLPPADLHHSAMKQG